MGCGKECTRIPPVLQGLFPCLPSTHARRFDTPSTIRYSGEVFRGGVPLMYYLGRGLQVLGMANLGVALFVGFTEEHGMGPELLLLGIGAVLFMVGRFLQGREG